MPLASNALFGDIHCVSFRHEPQLAIKVTYVRLAHDFVYLAVIMDVFTRGVRGWHLSRLLDRELTLTALRRALADHVSDIHHSDQGMQYACGDYTDLLAYNVQISMAAVGKPEDNGYAERLMPTIKEEEVDLSEYEDFHAAYGSIGRFLDEVYYTLRCPLCSPRSISWVSITNSPSISIRPPFTNSSVHTSISASSIACTSRFFSRVRRPISLTILFFVSVTASSPGL
jgi:transposase InsO family protein